MSKSSKSITASFGLIAAGLEPAKEAPVAEARPAVAQPKVTTPPAGAPQPRVGAGVIGAAQRSIEELRIERDRLKAQLEAGSAGHVELDPALIDPSPYPDRLPEDDDESSFAAFRSSFETEGQKIPIQVRPHPEARGRYQVVYGHRRLRAARELGVRVKAVVTELSDRDLVVSQGIENAARQDLTWIERALFASRMDEAGVKPRDIYAALSIDDAELARMRGVYRTIPRSVIEAIGRAPKVGRPRWGEFARLFATHADAEERVLKTLSADRISKLASDDRFRHALSALQSPAAAARAEPVPVLSSSGKPLGTLKLTDKEFRLTLSGPRGEAFAAFLAAELPDLVERFEKANTAQNPVS